MNWFKKFMAGRYGSDQLSMALLILSVLLLFISGLSPRLRILTYLSYIPLILCLLRMFSKNIDKRRMENYKFSILVSPVYARIRRISDRLKHYRTHMYFSCPNCRQKLRVPRGKGKIRITCPRCKTELIKKT